MTLHGVDLSLAVEWKRRTETLEFGNIVEIFLRRASFEHGSTEVFGRQCNVGFGEILDAQILGLVALSVHSESSDSLEFFDCVVELVAPRGDTNDPGELVQSHGTTSSNDQKQSLGEKLVDGVLLLVVIVAPVDGDEVSTAVSQAMEVDVASQLEQTLEELDKSCHRKEGSF